MALGNLKGEAWAPRLLRIDARPRTSYCSQGRVVLATSREGHIEGYERHGLFVGETRMLSRYRHLIEGKPGQMVVASNIEQHSWLGYYVTPPPDVQRKADTGSGAMENVSEKTLEIKVSRTVGLGVHEDIDLTNFTQKAVKFTFAIELDADFADQSETSHPERRGKIERHWAKTASGSYELRFNFAAVHRYSHQGDRGTMRIERELHVRIENSDSEPSWKSGQIRFRVRLKPQERWHTCVAFTPVMDGAALPPLYACREFVGGGNELERKRKIFFNEASGFTNSAGPGLAETAIAALLQAKDDLADLRLPDLDDGDHSWVMATGLPIYIALFGRDTLTASWQAAMLSPTMMRGTLGELPKWQGTRVDDWRDEQPGRMLHEAHTGVLASLNYNPRSRYYGAATTSGFYPVVLSEYWHWTGDEATVRRLIDPALRGLQWKDEYTTRYHDGFYEYQTHSEQGNRNQGWKDSGDAIVYDDGSQVKPPISTCEEQGFVYAAKHRMAEILWLMGDRAHARRIHEEGNELKKRFNDRFWMPSKKFYALGLDSKRRQIKSISSNPGHLLSCGIADKDRAKAVAARLLSPEMFSGWGVRTLSAEHPAYDPYSYHRGSVWPVEHGSFAMGMMRFGLYDEMHTLARAMFELSSLFDYHRLPECFSGHPRDKEHPFPALYPKANWPQAWSASSLFTIMQAMLGIYPYAPLHLLLVDPHLPDWLPEIKVHNLRVGEARVTLRFYNQGGRSHYEVVDQTGKLRILRQPSPWSLTAGLGERFKDVMESLTA